MTNINFDNFAVLLRIKKISSIVVSTMCCFINTLSCYEQNVNKSAYLNAQRDEANQKAEITTNQANIREMQNSAFPYANPYMTQSYQSAITEAQDNINHDNTVVQQYQKYQTQKTEDDVGIGAALVAGAGLLKLFEHKKDTATPPPITTTLALTTPPPAATPATTPAPTPTAAPVATTPPLPSRPFMPARPSALPRRP